MKKFLFTLSLIFIISIVSAPFCFAYSFTEFPMLSNDERFKQVNIILKDSYDDIYYFTSLEYPNFFKDGDFYFLCSNSFKLYQLTQDKTSWQFLNDVNTYGEFNFIQSVIPLKDFILCSDVTLNLFIDGLDDNFFVSNSFVPSVNWQQLQYKEQQKINSKLIEINNLSIGIFCFVILIFCYFVSNSIFGLLRKG